MGHDDHYLELNRLINVKEIDTKLEKIAYGFFGSLVRKVGRGVKKGFYYLIGKKYD